MRHFVLCLITAWVFFLVNAAGATQDNRIRLGLQDDDRTQFLSEMRQMLVSIQGVLEGIALEDREKIKQAARYSGNRMSRNTPRSVRSLLPESFRQIGGPTHLMFEELVIRADTDEMSDLVEFTAELMKQCITCHAQFRVD